MSDSVNVPRISMAHEASRQRLASEEKQRLDRAYDRIKEFPEFNPNERVHWLEFRAAFEAYRERWG